MESADPFGRVHIVVQREGQVFSDRDDLFPAGPKHDHAIRIIVEIDLFKRIAEHLASIRGVQRRRLRAGVDEEVNPRVEPRSVGNVDFDSRCVSFGRRRTEVSSEDAEEPGEPSCHRLTLRKPLPSGLRMRVTWNAAARVGGSSWS